MKDDSGDENSESNDSSKESGEESGEDIASGEEIEKSGEEIEESGEEIEESGEEDEDEGREVEGDEIEIESEEDEDEGEEIEDEGEVEGEGEVENAVDPTITASIGSVGPVGPAGFVGPAGPVGSAPAPTIGSSGAPAIAILPPTPIKNKGKGKATPDDNQEDMLQVNHDYPPDLNPDSLMGDNDQLQYKLKCGREHSGTGDARGIKTHRRSASHSTAPTVASTEDDEVDPHGSSRTTGGFSRGKAMGNNYNWGDADDVVDLADWNAPTKGKVFLYVNRDTGSSPYISFTTEATSELPVVLKELSEKFSPIKRRDSHIYVFEDEMWEVKG